MKVIALLAWKGGVGKSTLTINLATAAIEDGHKVGIIDLDPQSSLSEWSDRREAEQPFVSDAKPRAVAQIVAAGRGIGLDLMLIDTPPNATDEVEAALTVADTIIIRSQFGFTPGLLPFLAHRHPNIGIKHIGIPGCCLQIIRTDDPATRLF